MIVNMSGFIKFMIRKFSRTLFGSKWKEELYGPMLYVHKIETFLFNGMNLLEISRWFWSSTIALRIRKIH